MASTVNQQQSFPAVPPSFSAGDHEMRDYHAPQDAPLPQMNQTPYLTPYLGLRARLSQIWINRWTILLLLVLVRLLFAIANVNNSLASARTEALSACTQVENIGSSLASMPYYMAQGVNELTATGVEKAVSGLMSMLSLSVTGVEEIVLFVINMMTGTYLCLITLAVTGSLHAAVELGEEVVANLNKTIDSVTGDMGSAVSSVNSEISSLISKIQSLPFVPGFSTPTIDLNSSITALKGLESDTPTLTSDLQKLNDSIPTFDQVKNFTNNAISLPFEEVQKLIQGMNNFTFDRSLLPVPDKETLSFCSDGNSINDFFDELVKLELTAKKIALIVLIIFAILVCVPMAWSETRRHRRIENRVSLLAKGHDGMDVVYLTSRPLSSTFGLWLGNRFGSTRRQNIVRWAWAYATSLPMLFLLSLAIAGLFSCFCQYLLLRGIQKEVPELTTEVAGFAEKVVNSLNNASESWATGVNGAMGKLDADINNDILGWVNTTTGAINNTLNTFINETSEVLNSTFGGTILYDPIKDVLNCLIGLKVASFQAGLTWVSDHAHVSFPSLSNDTFSLGTLARLSNSSTAADLLSDPDGTTKDDITEAIDKVVNYILSGIRTEAEISLTLLLVWLFIATGGFLYACTLYPRQYQAPGESTAYNIDPAIDGEPKVEAYPDTAAPPYEYPVNKAAPYTLPHRQFPTFGPNDNVNTESESEKVGQVGAYPVAESSRPGHLRASSHGHLAQPSPIDDKQNPFLSDDEKRNPFK